MRGSCKQRNKTKIKRIRMRHYANDIVLLYKLIEETVRYPLGNVRTSYSLSVTKVDNAGQRREVKVLSDISGDKEEAYRIYDMVSRGLVTPCTAAEIVGDIIGILNN